ncbi:MAG: hypothetical protein IJS45_05975 [Clostridia bacterium]|nr:hypothetical protein [Clostridia bacterium]
MRIPDIRMREPEREEIRTFFGLNVMPSAKQGESRDEENVSSRLFPFLAPRQDAVRFEREGGTCRALIPKDQLVSIIETPGGEYCRLYYAGQETGLLMTPGEKQTVSMGTKVIIFPDKVWYDTKDGTYGSLDASFTSQSGVSVSFALSDPFGGEYEYDASPTAPESPADGAAWCDTSVTPNVLYRYSESSDTWAEINSTFVKISSPGIGQRFRAGDGVTLSGSSQNTLDGAAVIEDAGDDFILVPGIISSSTTQDTPFSVTRAAPEIDFCVEHNNRLWACRSGLSRDGEYVNEIYASKLGDPFNWNAFSGLVSDSYAASVGTDGVFTGCAVYLGTPSFFKEGCVHKVYGTRPSNFRIVASSCDGVARGASRSVAECCGSLYYLSKSGFMQYDGSYPQQISNTLGELAPSGAVSCVCDGRVYLFIPGGTRSGLYVYDAMLSVWHRYGESGIEATCRAPSGILAATPEEYINLDSKDAGASAGAFLGDDSGDADVTSWRFETGELTAERDDMYVDKIELTCAVPEGGHLTVELITGEDEAMPVVTLSPSVRRTFTVPVITPRHRRCRLRISGAGQCVVYSISKFVERT